MRSRADRYRGSRRATESAAVSVLCLLTPDS
jgi:hypothetical protein